MPEKIICIVCGKKGRGKNKTVARASLGNLLLCGRCSKSMWISRHIIYGDVLDKDFDYQHLIEHTRDFVIRKII